MGILEEAILDVKQVREAAEKNALRIILEKQMPRINKFIEEQLDADFDVDDEFDENDNVDVDVSVDGEQGEEGDKALLHNEEDRGAPPIPAAGLGTQDSGMFDGSNGNDNGETQSPVPAVQEFEPQQVDDPVFNIDVDFDEDEFTKEEAFGGEKIMASELYKLLEMDMDMDAEEEELQEGSKEEEEDASLNEGEGCPVADDEEVDEWVEINEDELEAALAEMDAVPAVDEGPDQPYDKKAKVDLDGTSLALKEAVGKYQRQLKEMRNVVNTLKNQVLETNLFNAKLLYATKLVNRQDITQEDKKKVINTLDKAKSVSEVKIVSETFESAFSSANKVTRQVNESAVRAAGVGGSSRAQGSGASTRKLNESAEITRWRTLAGLTSAK